MKHTGKSGATLAAAAFALAIAGSAMTMATPSMAQDAKIQCFGVNSCKGQSACKTTKSSCKGLNSCSGQGFLEMTKADCTAKGGTLTQM